MDELTQVVTTEPTEQPPAQAVEDFDPERAKALIAKLRGEEKRAKQLEKELASIRQADEERKLAEMSMVERLQAELAKANEARQRLEAENGRQIRTNAIIAAAAKAGMNDPQDAVLILADADGDDLDAAIEKLRQSKPYLFKITNPAYSPTNPAGGAAKQSDDAILAEIYGSRKTSLWGGGGVVWGTPTE